VEAGRGERMICPDQKYLLLEAVKGDKEWLQKRPEAQTFLTYRECIKNVQKEWVQD
jgi:hypothetical protein